MPGIGCTVFVLLILCLIPRGLHSQALNGDISDIGTSFTFSANPICAKCVELEVGASVERGIKVQPEIVGTYGIGKIADVTALISDNQVSVMGRLMLLNRNRFTITVAPMYSRITNVSNSSLLGGAVALSYEQNKNIYVFNALALQSTSGRVDNNRLVSFNYFRTISNSGYALFAGLQRDAALNISNVEQGVVIPFRHGQLEFEIEEQDVGNPVFIGQVRFIVIAM